VIRKLEQHERRGYIEGTVSVVGATLTAKGLEKLAESFTPAP
jgi:hypothetical protein